MTIEFPELYEKFLALYWDGDIDNALKVGYDSRERHQQEIDCDFERVERFDDFATERSMLFRGRVQKIYDATEYWRVYLAKVFIVNEGTNVLRFEFGGSIDYPKDRPLPCKPDGVYTFSGRIGSAHFSWSYMNPRHIYAPYGFQSGASFLCLDVTLDNATCTVSPQSAYTGRDFGLSGGEQFRESRPRAHNAGGSPRQGCMLLPACLAIAICIIFAVAVAAARSVCAAKPFKSHADGFNLHSSDSGSHNAPQGSVHIGWDRSFRDYPSGHERNRSHKF